MSALHKSWNYLIAKLKLSQNKKGQISSCTIFDSFFSAASCKEKNKKWSSWKIFWPFLFCDGFKNRSVKHFFSDHKWTLVGSVIVNVKIALSKAAVMG